MATGSQIRGSLAQAGLTGDSTPLAIAGRDFLAA